MKDIKLDIKKRKLDLDVKKIKLGEMKSKDKSAINSILENIKKAGKPGKLDIDVKVGKKRQFDFKI